MYIQPGFSESMEKESASEKDYNFLGATLPRELLLEDGDWRPYYPQMEIQRKAFDTYSCVSFANNNVEEMMHKKRYGVEVNRSDRFLSVVSGTVPGKGNSHKNVAEAKRKKGIVSEKQYPFTNKMQQSEFFLKPSDYLSKEAMKWVEDTEYGYEGVSRKNFKEALKYSPIQVAVDSRTNKTSGYRVADHSIVITHIDENNAAHVFDSYFGRVTKYEPDYPFSYGLRVHYKKKLNIIIEDYSMQLIRNKETGQIYMVDSDGGRHWVEAPTDFESYFGSKIWLAKEWVNMSPEQINMFPEGISISAKKNKFAEAMSDLFKKFKS